jgi:hypothetical protein
MTFSISVLAADDIVNKDKDRIKRDTLISGEINIDYFMAFSILALVSSRDKSGKFQFYFVS